jgi:hypothetical protein
MLEYRGYVGTVEADDGVFVGRVTGLHDVITFEGATFAEVEQAFRDSIEDYLAFCAERGEPPDRSYSGKIPLRVIGEAPPGGDARTRGGDEPQSMDCAPNQDRNVNLVQRQRMGGRRRWLIG